MSVFGPNSRIDAFVKRWLEDTSSMIDCDLDVLRGFFYDERECIIENDGVWDEDYQDSLEVDFLYRERPNVGPILVICFAKSDGSVMEFHVPYNGIDNTYCRYFPKYNYEGRSRVNVYDNCRYNTFIGLICHPSVCRIIEKVLYKRFPDVIRKYHAQYDSYWLERHPKVRWRK